MVDIKDITNFYMALDEELERKGFRLGYEIPETNSYDKEGLIFLKVVLEKNEKLKGEEGKSEVSDIVKDALKQQMRISDIAHIGNFETETTYRLELSILL